MEDGQGNYPRGYRGKVIKMGQLSLPHQRQKTLFWLELLIRPVIIHAKVKQLAARQQLMYNSQYTLESRSLGLICQCLKKALILATIHLPVFILNIPKNMN